MRARRAAVSNGSIETSDLLNKWKDEDLDSGHLLSHLHLAYRLIVVGLLLFILIIVTVGAGYLMMFIETTAQRTTTFGWDECFKSARENMTNTTLAEPVLKKLENCLETGTKIKEPEDGFLFSWMIFTTVGYGNIFPHTAYGQMVAVLYAIILSPLHTALKTEFGEMIALIVVFISRKICRAANKGLFHNGQEPSDKAMLFALALVVFLFAGATSAAVMTINEISYLNALYLTMFTVALIGLGDQALHSGWMTFAFLIPLFLIGESLYSYLNFYILGLYRLIANHLATAMFCCKTKVEHVDVEYEPVTKKGRWVTVFPTVSHNVMPFFPHPSPAQHTAVLARTPTPDGMPSHSTSLSKISETQSISSSTARPATPPAAKRQNFSWQQKRQHLARIGRRKSTSPTYNKHTKEVTPNAHTPLFTARDHSEHERLV